MRLLRASLFSLTLLVLMVVLMTSGCGSILDMQNATAEEGAQAADQSLMAGIFLVCPGSSNGAVWRRFKTAEEYDKWAAFCAMATENGAEHAKLP